MVSLRVGWVVGQLVCWLAGLRSVGLFEALLVCWSSDLMSIGLFEGWLGCWSAGLKSVGLPICALLDFLITLQQATACEPINSTVAQLLKGG